MTDWKDNEDVGKDYGPDEDENELEMDYETLLEYVDELKSQEEKLHDQAELLDEKMIAIREKIERLEEKLDNMVEDGDGI